MMARYGTTTTLGPKRVILLAREHFGPDSRLALPISQESWTSVTFEGGGGGVTVTVAPRVGQLDLTDVEIASREYDYWAERFLGRLADETGPLARVRDQARRLWRRLRGRSRGGPTR